MELYIITIFLNKDTLKSRIEELKEKNIQVKTFEEKDQTGETATANTFTYRGVNFLLGEANHFHTHMDFEIGMTCRTRNEFINFRNQIKEENFQKLDQEDGTLLAIPNSGHNPFFFIFDRNIKSSLKEVKCIEAEILETDYEFIQKEILTHLQQNIKQKLIFKPGTVSRITNIVFFDEVQKFLDAENKISCWPVKENDKQLVMEYLASKFQNNVIYREKEINNIIIENHSFMNTTMLRRELIERNLLARKDDCTEYWKL